MSLDSHCGDCRFESSAFSERGADIFSSRPVFSAMKSCSIVSEGGHDTVCLRSIMSWLERVLMAVDCYSWIFSQNLLTPAQLLAGMIIAHRMAWTSFVFCFCTKYICFYLLVNMVVLYRG